MAILPTEREPRTAILRLLNRLSVTAMVDGDEGALAMERERVCVCDEGMAMRVG